MMGSVMTDVKPPKPVRVTRRERARATRLRITKAAYALFCERGYAGTTMADVAVAAGVAVQTVYFTFHTKSELLSGAYELAVLGEVDPLPPAQQPWYVAASEERDVHRALPVLVRGVGEIVRRAAPLDALVQATGSHDPEAAAIRVHHERLRADGYLGMVEMLQAKVPLRAGLTLEMATELMLFYLGPHAFRGLVTDGGWAYDDWLDWTVGTIYEQFFGIGAQTE
jgi:AcrR family transcriptional regulator